jgi:poly-gamma-glutamate capsule biosynthesis protein CapA/YwtB (metallophosphatase superfamily)
MILKFLKLLQSYFLKLNLIDRVLLLSVVGSLSIWYGWPAKTIVIENVTTPNPVIITNKNNVRLIATGDWLPHSAINQAAKKTDDSYDYYQYFSEFQPVFDRAGVRFCNQAVLAGGSVYGISGYPIFNAPLDFSKDMIKIGCNVINTASNHTNDKNQEVINSSIGVWSESSKVLAAAGANKSLEDQNTVRYFEKEGLKFALLSYSTYTNKPSSNSYSLNMYSREFAQKQILEVRAKADIVLVSMRWGTEYSSGVNDEQRRLALELNELGADIVLGHGPHVLEPVQTLSSTTGRRTVVWYSIGNFFNAQIEKEALTGCVAVIDFDTNTKQVASNACLPYYMHYDWSAEDKKTENLLARKNFKLNLLEGSDELIKQSQLGTSEAEQLKRINGLLNTITPTNILTKAQYFEK